VTITGTWLTNATAVYFVDSVAGTSTLATIVPGSNTGTQLVVISPKGVAGDTVGIKVVTVSGSDANWTVTAGDQFTYVAAPTVSSVAVNGGPATGAAGGGTTVTIQGTNLTNAVAVYFDAGDDRPGQRHRHPAPGRQSAGRSRHGGRDRSYGRRRLGHLGRGRVYLHRGAHGDGH
jgi:hypothetical protein